MSAAASASPAGAARVLPPRLRGRPVAAAPGRLVHARAALGGRRACSCAAAAGNGSGSGNGNGGDTNSGDNNNNNNNLPSLDEDDLPPRSSRGAAGGSNDDGAASRPCPAQPPPSPPPEPLAAELARVSAPQRREALRRAAERLDLAWSIARSARGGARARSACACCSGSGRSECRWCRGTGAMMVGGSVLERAAGGGEAAVAGAAAADGDGEGEGALAAAASVAGPPPTCLVCKGRGHVACEDCRGTGYRASWMGPSECKTR